MLLHTATKAASEWLPQTLLHAATKAETRVVTFHAFSLQGGPLVVYRLRGCHIRTKQSTLHDSWEPGGPPGTCHVTTFPHPATASSWVCDGQNANKTM